MEQSQWQRPAAPSFHRKPPILPPLSSSGPVLFPLWGRGWGSNDGRYPLARNGKSHLNIHPLLVFCPIRPSSEFILSTILLPACSSPLVYLILSCSETRSIGTHTNKHTVYSPPVPRASCLSLIRVSSEWGGGGCRPYTCPQINPAVWLGSAAAGPVIPAFLPALKTEKIIKYHLIRSEKAHSWSLTVNAHKQRVWGVKEWWKIIEGSCANFCFLSTWRAQSCRRGARLCVPMWGQHCWTLQD